MTTPGNLAAAKSVAFVPISDKDQALAFYRDQLGLTLVEDQSPFALVFELQGPGGVMLRATFAGEFTAQQFTVLGWQVADIETVVGDLKKAGVTFNHYPWVDTPTGIWTAPGGTRIAWFNDPFGNVLSLQQEA